MRAPGDTAPTPPLGSGTPWGAHFQHKCQACWLRYQNLSRAKPWGGPCCWTQENWMASSPYPSSVERAGCHQLWLLYPGDQA